MKLYCNDEVAGAQGLWCHQSRLAGVVGIFVWSGVLAIPIILGWHFQKSWPMWLSAVLAVILIPLVLMDVAARFRATNWILLIGTDGIWINLCSYRDKVPAVPSVVRIDFREIASAGKHVEAYSTPSAKPSAGTTVWRAQFLEIQLVHDHTDELIAALNNLRQQPEPEQQPSRQAPVRNGPFPVWLVSSSVLRIAWLSGHGHAVAPRMARALARLETNVPITTPTRRDWPNWRQLTATEVEVLARELVHVYGDDFVATALLVRAGGLTHAEANTLMQRFAKEPADWPEHPIA